MSAFDVPPRLTSELDQAHAAVNAKLDTLIADFAAEGLLDLDAPARATGIRLALTTREVTHAGALTLAALAISRLYDTDLEGIDPS